jgi:hypothetical protein
VQVGDAGLPLQDPGALQLDVLGAEALEQTAPLAKEHRDEMELELVQDAGGESVSGPSLGPAMNPSRGHGHVENPLPPRCLLLGLWSRGRRLLGEDDSTRRACRVRSPRQFEVVVPGATRS